MSSVAQYPTPPARDDYVFHIYVDPIFGDDALAWASNPGTIGGGAVNPRPLDFHPDAQNAPRRIGGLVQHAPYSFRTLTGAQGVAAYIAFLTQQYGQTINGTRVLPWSIGQIGGATKTVQWVVVHALPGVYGPWVAPGEIDPASGLPWNGESWPFSLPHRVSLQGTSALDTVLDGRGELTGGAVIAAGFTFFTDEDTHEESMIDGITVRGARSDGSSQNIPNNYTGAAIYIGREANVRVTISNCFLVDNDVGLALENPANPRFINRPMVVNNTFARNVMGIWSGDRQSPSPNVGNAQPTILNNVFDPWIENGLLGVPFVGMSAEDLTVQLVTSSSVDITVNADFNAWNPAGANGMPPVMFPNWPFPVPRTTTPLPAPRVDITAFVGVPPAPRGILFVNDALRAAAVGGAGVDHSPHDFRLAPNVSVDGAPPAQPPAGLNPLVNHGLYLSPTITRIRMVNGNEYLERPGLPFGAEPVTRIDAWDLDAEGFGNPRVVDRTPFTADPVFGALDLGADELGDLILAGYIDRTRIFGSTVPNAPGITDHTRIFFVEVNTTAAMYPRPIHNAIQGKTYEWWPHVQGAPDAVPPNNYTAGVGYRQAFAQVGLKPLFMRNLECDFSPQLSPDIHPAWTVLFGPTFFPSAPPDIYGCNPWYWSLDNMDTFIQVDNPFVYFNPSPGFPVHTLDWTENLGSGATLTPFTNVLAPMVNPPGSAVTASGSYLSSYFGVRSGFVNRTCTFSRTMASAVHDPDHG